MDSFIHEYIGYGRTHSECTVHIMKVWDTILNENTIYVGFEDNGIGTSVTNCAEKLATEIVELKKLDPERCYFFEWYPYYEDKNGGVSMIEYKWKDNKAYNATWSHYCSRDDNPFFK